MAVIRRPYVTRHLYARTHERRMPVAERELLHLAVVALALGVLLLTLLV
jgi:hypothetical protein